MASNTLKISIAPSLPLDPLSIQTMADYDFALCLYRTWFNYDLSGKATAGLIKNWEFDSNVGAYVFHIDENAKWSNGAQLTSEVLLKNLKRAIKSKSSYGKALECLINIKSAKIINELTFTIPTKNKKPSEAFFQRMGSIFLAVTNPLDWKDDKIISNKYTIGTYKISNLSEKNLLLTRNPHSKNITPHSADEIIINLASPAIDIDDFINGNGNTDIIQTNSLMPIENFNKIISSNFPFWTRAFDRVSYLAPIKPYDKNPEGLRAFIRLLGANLNKHKVETHKFIKRAHSLQPIGYPLHKEIEYASSSEDLKLLPKSISILVIAGPQFKFQKTIIENEINSIKPDLKIEWIIKNSISEFLEVLSNSSTFDLKLLSFGVADPEAATWMSLVINRKNPFIELKESEIIKFEKIVSNHSEIKKENTNLSKLLNEIGKRGGYLPLFHFSTLSIGKPGLSFENIHELDETVDYGKIIFK